MLRRPPRHDHGSATAGASGGRARRGGPPPHLGVRIREPRPCHPSLQALVPPHHRAHVPPHVPSAPTLSFLHRRSRGTCVVPISFLPPGRHLRFLARAPRPRADARCATVWMVPMPRFGHSSRSTVVLCATARCCHLRCGRCPFVFVSSWSLTCWGRGRSSSSPIMYSHLEQGCKVRGANRSLCKCATLG